MLTPIGESLPQDLQDRGYHMLDAHSTASAWKSS
jgi:hypothetical protein